MSEIEWEPTIRPVIVASANKLSDGTMLIGVRHWDALMRDQFQAKYGKSRYKQGQWYRFVNFLQGRPPTPKLRDEQGFIDQFARFYQREEAMLLARQNDQIILPDDQMLSLSALHSEDLW